MDHEIRVHKQFYRLPEKDIEAAKVTKIVHALNKESKALPYSSRQPVSKFDVNSDQRPKANRGRN